MIDLRKYGNKPYNIADIHGGPGAPGSMGKVAKELSKVFGVLEPMQFRLYLRTNFRIKKYIRKI